MVIEGRVHKYGSNIDTDVIISARYLTIADIKEMSTHCFEDIDPDFVHRVKPGDIIVAGSNFGSGSSREWAPIVIKANGVGCVIANSFSRIFFRNAINVGLPILHCDEAVDGTEPNDVVRVDLASGRIFNINKNTHFTADLYPDFILKIIKSGGLIKYTARRLSGSRN